MRSLKPASLSAAHVQRRRSPVDASPKTGDLTHVFATPPNIPEPSPPSTVAETPAPEWSLLWPPFPVRHEERGQIEARGDCAPVTYADLMRRVRIKPYSPPARQTPSLPRRLVGVILRAVGLGRHRSQS